MTGQELLRDCPAAEDECAAVALSLAEEPMPQDPATRTTVYVKDVNRLAKILGLPADTDASKVVRLGADRIEQGQDADRAKIIRAWLVDQQQALMERA